jgi:uncharacterized membrane protein
MLQHNFVSTNTYFIFLKLKVKSDYIGLACLNFEESKSKRMRFLDSLIYSQHDCITTTARLLKQLKVPYTRMTLQNKLQEHSSYPAMLCVSDILKEYGVDNISLKCTPNKLSAFPLPLVTHLRRVKDGKLEYTVINNIGQDEIQCYDAEKKRWLWLSKVKFAERWSGIVLLPEVAEDAGEKKYLRNKAEEKKKKNAILAGLLFLPLATVISGAIAITMQSHGAILPSLYMLLPLTGATVSTVLLWYEIDQHNSLLRQICKTGKKVNCNAILQSKASTIAGISWGRIGFSYFAGTLLLMLLAGVTNAVILYMLTWLNTVASLFIFFSVYYQWRVAKQWCVLCLYVQAILAAQFAVGLSGGWHGLISITDITPQPMVIAILSFALPFMLTAIALPAFKNAKEGRRYKTEMLRLKHNPQIFNALLEKQKTVTENPEGLGVLLGNPDATHRIIKVCNPYCGPCAKAHPEVEALLHNNEGVQVQIIFTATNDERDFKAPPVKHLLAIAEKEDAALLKKALDDWYLPEKKEYEKFARRYPMNGELNKQGAKLDAMKQWCDKTGIYFTPAFFIALPAQKQGETIKYYQLPEIYSVKELKYFLSV